MTIPGIPTATAQAPGGAVKIRSKPMYTPPYIVFNDRTGDKRAFLDPADAIEFIVQEGDAVDVIDGNGTTIYLKELEREMKMYDAK
jgi:hypothetical protein